MSYFYDAFDDYCLMEKTTVDDGSGDYFDKWREGVTIKASLTNGQSSEIRQAEAQGLKTVFTVTFPIPTPVKYDNYIKNKQTGAIYRITSRPGDNKTPADATYPTCYATAERTELPAI